MGSGCSKNSKTTLIEIPKHRKKKDLEILNQNYDSPKIFNKISINNSEPKPIKKVIEEIQKKNSGKPFLDKNFPPEKDSLTQKISNNQNFNKIIWQRPSEFSQQELTLFTKKISPSDIKPGELSDLYLLSAISILLEKDITFIKRLFENDKINAEGCYAIWLNINGFWEQIILDDYIPCGKNSKPSFAHAVNSGIWISLLEKAYAKAFGTYQSIEKGKASDTLRDLTGAKVENYFKLNEEDLWQLLEDNRLSIIVASNEEEEEIKEESVTNNINRDNYCFAILDWIKLENGQKAIKMRNPFKFEEKWDSLDYNEDKEMIVKKFGEFEEINNSNEEGVFWISLKNFCKKFNKLSICNININYYYDVVSVESKKNFSFVGLDVPEQSHCWIELNQKDFKSIEENKENFSYELVRLGVVELIGDYNQTLHPLGKFIRGIVDKKRNVGFQCNLMAGRYLIFFEVGDNNNTKFNISAYTQKKIYLDGENEILKKINKEERFLELRNELLRSHAIQGNEINQVRETKYEEENKLKRYVGNSLGYVYIFYKNLEEKCILREDLKIENIVNLISLEENNSFEFKIDVKGKKEKMLLFKIKNFDKFGYKLTSSYFIFFNFSETELINRCLSNPTKIKQREFKGDLIEVFINLFIYSGGMALLYINKSKNFLYSEKLRLKLVNLKIDSNTMDPEKIFVNLQPENKMLINLKIVDENQPIYYKMFFENDYLSVKT